jgi:hypothetical protein
MLAAL